MTSNRGNQVLVRLTFEERQLLLERFRLSAELRLGLARGQGPLDVWMSTDEAEDLREQAGDFFQLFGLDESMKPTASGRVLDSLIDKLFTG